MKKIIFLDTETTGNEPVKDYLCQLAFKSKDETFCELFKPPIPIPPETSAITHITNKMVAGKKAFQESGNYGAIKLMLESPLAVMVAHNAKFDAAIIKKEGIVPANIICTLRVARALDKDNVIPQYKLQYLRYYMDIDVEADAHDALGDVLVLEKLFERLYEKVLKEIKKDPLALTGTPYRSSTPFGQKDVSKGLALGSLTPSSPPSQEGEEMQVIEKMIEISGKPSLMNMFSFGKYNGKTIAEVAQIDKGYLEWMLAQKKQNPDNEEDWIYTLRYYLNKLK
ncbi:MAG TPA: 3'-5' exonuclease [Candidatus Paceibacterota bacterium]|jgi:DNA polymerase III epsilon subunit-like protein|nr:3'-5' exonuclease [Candidatus Paceibacterota bacterium]